MTPTARAPDYLEQAITDDQSLARQISAESRRPVPKYDRRDTGPTEAWRLFLADTDPEWGEAA